MPPTDPDAAGHPDGEVAESGDANLPARRSGGSVSISQEQLERVIRRASDLQFRSSTSVGGTLAPGEVVKIGEEVGLEPRYVKQALAEVQAASLVPSEPEDDGVARRILGSGSVRASRVVPGDRAHVEHNLEAYLRDRELLRQVRSQPGRALWEPAGGLVSSMRRAMDVGGHGYTLAKAKGLQVAVEPLESGWSLVTLTADVANLRGERLGGWFGGMGAVGATGGIGLAVATGGALLPILGGIALFGGFMGIATAASRADMRKQRQRFQLVLEGLLDRLERGESLHDEAEPWHRRLLG